MPTPLGLTATIRTLAKGEMLVNERPTMPLIVERHVPCDPPKPRPTKDAKRCPRRGFRPQPIVCLETRALLSTFAASPSASRPAGRDDSETAPPWTEIQNVPFPTVDGQSELLDVYKPDTPAPAGGYPVMITIHGGGWREHNKGAFGLRNADVFTQDGYVVVSPDYVLAARGKPTWPVNFEDVQAAVRWVRSDAGSMGFNPDEIVAEGESAGANLAALLGVNSPQDSGGAVSSAVDAVVAVSTPTDLRRLYHEKQYAGTAAAEFLGGSPEQVPANFVAASPIDHIAPDDPPMILIHGRQDDIIPVSQSKDMQAALTAAGVRNQLLLVDGGHGLDFPKNYSELVPNVLAFLDTTWKGQ
jgi:acetyl esterase/lipase